MDRKPVLDSWAGSDDAPFLQGLSEFHILEDRMVDYDAGVFGDWEEVRRGAVGIAEFRDGERRLTVLNVNRAGVEHALGVDLLYYNHDFDAYVLVQYKRMTRRDDASGYEYRPNKQLSKELDRMRTLLTSDEASPDTRGFRLDDVGAYLKLCPSTTRDAFSHELIRGMYLPLRYWDVLVDSPDVLGPKGGIHVDFDNVGRHINNTLFIELVSSAWVGSRGVNTERITAIVRESLETRSLILAEARTEG